MPQGTKSFALAVLDKHHVARDYVHWPVADLSANTTSLQEGASARAMPTGPREIKAYVGPFPPSGTHDYKFTLYALAADKLDLSKITTEPVVSNALYWRYGRAATCAAGEPFKFGIDSTPPTRERLSELLQSCGLALRKQRTLGRETEKERAWGGFAVASAE